MSRALGSLACAAYILLRDGTSLAPMDRRSLGKRILKLRPIRLSGDAMNLRTSALRNWPLALPSLFNAIASLDALRLFPLVGVPLAWLLPLVGFIAVLGEITLALTQPRGQRFGDRLAHTELRSE